MSISYRNEISSKQTDSFSVALTETADVFKQKHGISIIGRDFEDILTSAPLFEEYVARFTEGMDATEAEQIQTFANSFRETCLQESLAGVQPYASLTMPVLVKLWARLSIKYAIPTEPVSQPAFTIAFMKPYILDDAGAKHYLPEAINDMNSTLADMPKVVETVALTNGKAEAETLIPAEMTNAKAGVGLFNVDKKFSVVSVTVNGKAYPCNIKLDLYRRLYGEVTTDAGTVIVFGSVDLENCTVTIATMGAAEVTEVGVLGWFSSENHTHATEVGFDMSRKDVEIGTATHIEASLPIELLQDTKAMYQVDGAAEVTDIMSNVCAQKVDMEIYNFLNKSFLESQTDKISFFNEFDVYPQGNFAVNPSEWLNELRKLIDYQATSMRNTYRTYNGYYVILGNPINTMLIPNVSWSFNSVNDTQNGVEVSYSIGALSGANRYTIISSDLIAPDDGLTIIFVPTTDKFKTFAYYPYTFNVVQNYLNARTPNVPSIMLTKRQTVEEFQRIIGRIDILNNDGTVYVRDNKVEEDETVGG